MLASSEPPSYIAALPPQFISGGNKGPESAGACSRSHSDSRGQPVGKQAFPPPSGSQFLTSFREHKNRLAWRNSAQSAHASGAGRRRTFRLS
jgi:hypothetical protein